MFSSLEQSPPAEAVHILYFPIPSFFLSFVHVDQISPYLKECSECLVKVYHHYGQFEKEAMMLRNINESIEKCTNLEQKAKTQSLWAKIFLGGDLETGKEMQSVSDSVLNLIENCNCEAEKQFKRCKTLGVMEEKRKGNQ